MDKQELYGGDPDAGVGELDQHDRRNAELKRQYENLPDDVKREHALRFGNAPVSQDDLKESVSDSPKFHSASESAEETFAKAAGLEHGSDDYHDALDCCHSFVDNFPGGDDAFWEVAAAAEKVLGGKEATKLFVEIARQARR